MGKHIQAKKQIIVRNASVANYTLYLQPPGKILQWKILEQEIVIQ